MLTCVCLCQITELLTDVERLKQALNGLSQLAYTGNAPSKRQTQHIDTLQAQIKSLQQQLAVSGHTLLTLFNDLQETYAVCANVSVFSEFYVMVNLRHLLLFVFLLVTE